MGNVKEYKRPRCPECDVSLKRLLTREFSNRQRGWTKAGWFCERCKKRFLTEEGTWLVPDGWVESYPMFYPGVFVSGPPESRPSTTLLQRLEAGLTLDQAKRGWLHREGEEEFPRRTSSRETPAFTWELYEHRARGWRGLTRASIGLAESPDGVYVVELWSPDREHEGLHQAVFLPVVDALAPAAAAP